MTLRNFIAAAAVALGVFAADAAVNVVPRPVSVEEHDGQFTLTSKTSIGYAEGLEEYAMYLDSILLQSTGYELPVVAGTSKAAIALSIDSAAVGASEGYRLEVGRKRITVVGADKGGLFYGLQTLLQLFPEQIHSDRPARNVEWNAPCVSIFDAPERPWRGMMLDVARYFHDVDYVKHYIDMMAMYKLNKLQFHMIDDSGWRMESKKYPRLTEVGAYAGTGPSRLGGYYTQDQIRDIIEYGRLRNVEIIPEIEFPAHILSAVVAYPWLSCTGLQHELPRQHFISRDLLCVGKESSMKFLFDILDETVELFPSKYINIGGDEAVYDRWKECPDCQALLKREGLSKASELQGWLTDTVARMMADRGRTVIGWEEIITRGDVSTPVVALIWHNVADSVFASSKGHQAILTPATHMYLDFPESSTPGEIKAAGWMPPISLEKAYSMPVNDYSDSSSVIGVQGCLWSDQFIHGTVLQELPQLDENRSEAYVDYLTFPRLLAVAEVAWDKESRRSWPDFRRRVMTHFGRLDAMGAAYRVPEPSITSMKELPSGEWEFVLEPSIEGSEIRYTTDGTYPTVHSALYKGGKVVAPSRSDFHAVTVHGRRVSLPTYFAPDYSRYERYGAIAGQWQPLQVQTVATPWNIDVIGKISGNGSYEITFIPEKGGDIHFGRLKLMKRDEQLADVDGDYTVKPGQTATYRFDVDAFEAGTPFTVVVERNGVGSNETSGLVFIRKL